MVVENSHRIAAGRQNCVRVPSKDIHTPCVLDVVVLPGRGCGCAVIQATNRDAMMSHEESSLDVPRVRVVCGVWCEYVFVFVIVCVCKSVNGSVRSFNGQ